MTMHEITSPGEGLEREVNVSAEERWASFLLGGMLALYGIQDRSLHGVLLALGGGSLIHRAVTGHSRSYAVLDINTALADEQHLDGGVLDAVEDASVDSFPASDPPGWTSGVGVGSPGL